MIRELPKDVDYRSYPAVSQSDLKRCWHEPELYYQESIAHTRLKPQTDAMRLGTTIEHYLKHDELPSDWVVIPDDVLASNGARLGNKYKEWAAQQPTGAILMKQSEIDDERTACETIAKQVDAHDLAAVATGRFRSREERAAMWNQRYLFDYEDIECKCEFDVFNRGHRVIADLKSTDDTHAEAFTRKAIGLGYDLQAYVYSYAASLICECDIDAVDYCFVVVRSKPPYNVETFRAPQEMIELGRRKFGAYLDFWKRCADSQNWRSQTHGQLIDLRVPRWALNTLYAMEEVEV